jgi:hypothetical protein
MRMLVHTQVNLRGRGLMFRRRGHFADTLLEKCNQMKRQTFLNAYLTCVRHVMLQYFVSTRRN